MKREKRLKKGIDSLEKQKEIHEEKFERALIDKNYERASYYTKEIKSMEIARDDKEAKLHRKDKKKHILNNKEVN